MKYVLFLLFTFIAAVILLELNMVYVQVACF